MDHRKIMEMPEADSSGFVPTLNQMGFMTSQPDPFSQAFIDNSANARGPVLEIGAAYGVATIEALKKGAHVIANDLDVRHLEILKERTPPHLQERLTLLPGAFPTGIQVSPSSISAILACRILHFFDGPSLEIAVQEFHRYLMPGGKLFIVADTPYLKPFQPFLSLYQQRKAQNVLWPGWITNLQDLARERASELPKTFHAFDSETLSRVLIRAGFRIEQIEYFPQKNYPIDIQLDGREGIGCIASREI
jgi:SAM-dependent methyltransferase